MSPRNKEYDRIYQLERYRKRRIEAIEYLGGECVQCGATERLELDHINPDTKSFEISKIWGIAQATFWDEVSKCQLLCKSHHVAKTKREQINEAHGTWGWIRNRKCKCDVCSEFLRNYHANRRKTLKETTGFTKGRSRSKV